MTNQSHEVRFHSINIPSEWEFKIDKIMSGEVSVFVSIQLISPASGNSFTCVVYGQ